MIKPNNFLWCETHYWNVLRFCYVAQCEICLWLHHVMGPLLIKTKQSLWNFMSLMLESIHNIVCIRLYKKFGDLNKVYRIEMATFVVCLNSTWPNKQHYNMDVFKTMWNYKKSPWHKICPYE